jgi:hypothetical protein
MSAVKTGQIFAIKFSRLPSVGGTPGLVVLAIDTTKGAGPLRKLGSLTDVALRGRLAHYDLHPANEVAAIRKALGKENGSVTVYETWSSLARCLQFWHGFGGSQIQPVEWTCEKCAAANRADVGASVGETFARACRCGTVKKITTTARLARAL